MTHSDYYSKLDIVLKFFYDNKDNGRMTMNRLEDANLFLATRSDLIRLVQKLIQDNYVDVFNFIGPFDSPATKHQITLDGILFYQTTSYSSEYLKSLKPVDKSGHDLSNSTFNNSPIFFGDSNINNPTTITDNSNTVKTKISPNLSVPEDRASKLVSVIIKYWWAVVIPLLVVLIGLAIEYKWFAKK